MIMVVAPTKKKADARAEREAARKSPGAGATEAWTRRGLTTNLAMGDHRGQARSGTTRTR